MARRRETWDWKKRVKRERRELERDSGKAVCWLCGEQIDMQLPYEHERAFTLDHVVPIARGGDLMGETRPAHRSCNSERGDGRRPKRQNTLLEW